MKNLFLLIACVMFLIADAYSFDVNLLKANKEAFSRELSEREIEDAKEWGQQHELGSDLRPMAIKALAATFNEMERIDTNCELGLLAQLQKDALKNRVIRTKEEVSELIKFLRQENLIDDILFSILKESSVISYDFDHNTYANPRRPFNLYTRQNSGIDLEKFYAPVKKWPDDIDKCALDTYWGMVSNISWKNAKDRDGQMLRLNYLAYINEVIDLSTFNKMETLRKRGALNWPVYFKRYADVINNAKDKLTKTPEVTSTNDFSVEYVSRKDQVTQRANLFRNYDSTQIILLAQIIEKTAKRMDSRRAYLTWVYTDEEDGEQEIYVLSPMEQYRAAIKMLRKDMAEVMRSDTFRGTGIQYEHLIAAAYEAGFIRSEELDYILKFEDFWNPKTPKWKAYANFAFNLAGTASFYLPPPWNVIGAIGLVLSQSKLVNGDQKPDPDNNWNVIL